MSRPKAASRVAASNAAASLAALLSPARAEASRRNGAKSKGPKTPEGKARSAQNALKHGLRAQRFTVVGDEDPQEFVAFEAALVDDLAPEGALQTLLAGRIARAAWRLQRAEQIEAELFAREMEGLFGDGDLGLALIRDGNGARAFDVLLRYRGAAQAEFSRALRMLKTLQAEAAQEAASRRAAQLEAAPQAALLAKPIEPEPRTNPHAAVLTAPADGVGMSADRVSGTAVRHAEAVHPLPCAAGGSSARESGGTQSPRESWRNGAQLGSRRR